MKQLVRLYVLPLCILSLLLSLVSPCLADEIEDCTELFDMVEQVDGAYADALAGKLGKSFNADPERFVEELAKENANRQNAVIDLLVYDQAGPYREAFLEKLEKLADSGTISAQAQLVVKAIQRAAGVDVDIPKTGDKIYHIVFVLCASIIAAGILALNRKTFV